MTERPGARTIERPEGVVEFGSVGFRYPETAGDAVSDISFVVAPGETLALVGPSGAGKSTIAKLLLRFYDPTVGAIYLDGIDVRDLKLHSLRDQVAAVFQETLVFDATIAENIAYGLPGASRKEIVAAAEQAALLPFVSKLPHGFETVVGENGRRLSGGQRQRIAIARAYLRKSPVLVLDEPTTGLDADAASRVLEPLRRLAADKTTILISHDLSLVRDATLILALDHGRIAESGTHGELVDDDGLYSWLSRPTKRRVQAVGV